MKPSTLFRDVCAASLLTIAITGFSSAQMNDSWRDIVFGERNMSGPRLGVTFIPGSTTLVQRLKEKNIGTMLSQFGWHFG